MISIKMNWHRLCVTLVVFVTPVLAQTEMIGAGHVSVDREVFLSADTQGKAEMLCAACHGENGSGDRFFGPDAMWGTPMIRGMNKDYFAEQLRKYQSGERVQVGENSGEMNRIMENSAMTEDVIDDISAYYAEMDRLSVDNRVLSRFSRKEKREFLLGGTIFHAQCAVCHGKDGMGVSGLAIPHLAGQIGVYLRDRMSFFAHEAESGVQSVMGSMLRSASLKHEEIEAIIFYLENRIGKR